MDEQVVDALHRIWTQFGQDVLLQPPRLASLLRDECPAAKPEISALVKALEEQVPQDLLKVNSGEPPRMLAARLAKRLSEQQLLEQSASSWAVWAWARGMGLGDEYRSAITASDAKGEAPARMPRVRWSAVLAVVGIVAAIGVAAVAGTSLLSKQRIQPPQIMDIAVPANLTTGQSYMFAIAFNNAAAGVKAVERRVVESSVQWQPLVTSLDLQGYEQQSAGQLQYQFRPHSVPFKATLEFVLVDTQGNRSAPKRVSYEVAQGAVTQAAAVPAADPAESSSAPGSETKSAPAAPTKKSLHDVVSVPATFSCADCGVISSIQAVKKKGESKGIGAVIGAAVGGAIGSLFGKGHGKTASTVAGAAGGAAAGNEAEKQINSVAYWNVTVRLDDGRKKTVKQYSEPSWHVGDHVKLVENTLAAE